MYYYWKCSAAHVIMLTCVRCGGGIASVGVGRERLSWFRTLPLLQESHSSPAGSNIVMHTTDRSLALVRTV